MTSAFEPNMIGNTRVLRNAQLDALSDAQLRAFSPAIFASGGMPGVSEKYGFVDTKAVIDAMRDSGFEPVEVRQSQRRNVERMGFTKHMLKFRPRGKLKAVQVGDVVPQVVALNSHDRSSGFHLYGGLFRLVCSNGMMVSDRTHVEPIRVPHTRHMVENIVARSQELVRGIDGVYRLRDDMLATKMTEKTALAFARQAVTFRPPRAASVDPATLLEARRPEDDALNLWLVFNRVQENMLRGGLVTKTEDGRTVMTRGIGRIERDVEVNTKLWALAV